MYRVLKNWTGFASVFPAYVYMMLVLFFVILFSGLFGQDVYGACSVGVTTTGDVSFDLLPKTEDVVNSGININTSCDEGYEVYIGGPSDVRLYRDSDNTSEEYIGAVSGTAVKPSRLSVDTYGYSLSDNVTVSSSDFIGLTNTQTLIASKDSPSAVAGDNIVISYGIRIANDKPSGSYVMANNGTITYYVLGKETITTTTVTLDANDGAIPAGQDWTGSGATATKEYEVDLGVTDYGNLPTPTKNGYSFLGWSRNNIPNEYQEVEYIESTGTQYILTDVVPTDTTGAYAMISIDNVGAGDEQSFFWFSCIWW